MRTPPQTLKALEFEKTNGIIDLSGLSSGGDTLTYEVGPWDWFNVQLVQVAGASWTGTCTIPVQCSNDGSSFVDFPVPIVAYTTTGMKERFRVTGYKQIRLGGGVATGSLGDATIRPILRGSQDP